MDEPKAPTHKKWGSLGSQGWIDFCHLSEGA